tara:strand:- start:754 stop:1080 length:327 start_codon:yes stop_codon:yes gene_type:complete
MNILKILETFYRDHSWNLVNDDYESLEWDENNSIPKPTLEELQDKWDNDRTPIENNQVNEERQVKILMEWPMEKQFEAITEFHMDRPEKLNQLLDFINQVKNDVPKTS